MRSIVVGAGISGLTAAVVLSDLGHEVVVIEMANRVGGKIRTLELHGNAVEAGPDSYLRRNPQTTNFISRFVKHEIHPTAATADYYNRDWTRYQIPSGLVLGAPRKPSDALNNPLVPPLSRLRAAAGAAFPRYFKPRSSDDLGAIAIACYGKRWAMANIEPLVGGINANTIVGLSASLSAPAILDLAGSARGAGPLRPTSAKPSTRPLFGAPANGLGSLVDAMYSYLVGKGVTFVEAEALAVVPAKNEVEVALDNKSLVGDTAVLAVPAYTASKLLKQCFPRVSEPIASIAYSSVSMLIAGGNGPLSSETTKKSGVLVDRELDLLSTAVSLYSSKWPTRVKDSWVIRTSAGSLFDRRHLQMDDRELEERLLIESGKIIGTKFEPEWTQIIRWPRSFPHFSPHHKRLVEKINHELKMLSHSRIALAGAWIMGSGIPSCVSSAHGAVSNLSGLQQTTFAEED